MFSELLPLLSFILYSGANYGKENFSDSFLISRTRKKEGLEKKREASLYRYEFR